MEIERSAYEHICTLFEGSAAEPGYGFLFGIEERGHDRLVEKLRRQVAGGYLRTIDLGTVYAQNETPKIEEVMRKERLASSFIKDKEDHMIANHHHLNHLKRKYCAYTVIH